MNFVIHSLVWCMGSGSLLLSPDKAIVHAYGCYVLNKGGLRSPLRAIGASLSVHVNRDSWAEYV